MNELRMRWAGHVACMGDMTDASKILAVKPKGKRFSGRTKRRREGDIKMGLKGMGCYSVHWIHVAQVTLL
jgi:hypothetical protein